MRIILALALLCSNIAHADEAECRAVLKNCDLALRAEQDVNAMQKQIISAQETVIQLQAEQLDSQSIWKPIAIGAVSVVILETLILVLKK